MRFTGPSGEKERNIYEKGKMNGESLDWDRSGYPG